ncbi:MAG: two-component regulator propeller domain-containing protein [Bacteroidota bacterium]
MKKGFFLMLILGAFHTVPLFCQTGDWLFYYEENSPLPSNYVRAITQDLDGVIWIGTGGGVLKIDNGTFEVFTTENSELVSNGVREIVVDQNNVKWFGTQGGLSSYDDGVWTSYTVSNSGLHRNFILCLALDEADNVWIGTTSNYPANTTGGVSRFDREEEWIHYNPDNSGLLSRNVRTIYPVDTNHVWFGCLGGLSIKDGEEWTNYTSQDSPLPYNDVRDIKRDDEGYYWFGTYSGGGPKGGIVRFDGLNDWMVYDTSNSVLLANSVGTVHIDSCGDVWCGNVYLNKFDGEEWTRYDTSNSPIHDDNIAIIYEDDRGNIWLGSITNGVGVFKNDCYDDVTGETYIGAPSDALTVYPNPFDDRINVELVNGFSGQYELQIYDAVGRLIKEEKRTAFPEENWVIDLHNQISGVYFYRIKSKAGIVSSGKIVKK